MKELLIATRNKKKLKEIKRLLKGSGIKIFCLDTFKDLPEVEEDGKTFNANARKKAIEISSRVKMLVMADDSGLEVSSLGNAPGIHSARYAGPSQNDDKNIKKLLKVLSSSTGAKRKARFRCLICLSYGKKVLRMIDGKAEGVIGFEVKGKTGFGYDPVFIPNGYNKTFAQLGSKEKDKISHRALALVEAKEAILKYFQKYR